MHILIGAFFGPLRMQHRMGTQQITMCSTQARVCHVARILECKLPESQHPEVVNFFYNVHCLWCYHSNIVFIFGIDIIFGNIRCSGLITISVSAKQAIICTQTFATFFSESPFLSLKTLWMCYESRIASLLSIGVPKSHNHCWRLVLTEDDGSVW